MTNTSQPSEETQVMAGTSLSVTKDAQGNFSWQCPDCGHIYGVLGQDPKLGAWQREVPMARISPWNVVGDNDVAIVREIFCPDCASMLAVEVRRRSDPVLLDTVMR